MNELQTQTSANFLTPQNLNEAMQIAEILASSDIVPKDYQRKPGNILVALQWGAEIGLQPLQALQNIACINGRPAIWGDAMIALVRKSGLMVSIEEEQTDEIATCTVQRKGEEPYTTSFSKEDAKRAGLSSKQGPWTQYPRRMMQLRARAYALRDVFPDVLKGMAMAEEERDKEEIDVTPKPVSTSAKPNSGTASLKARISKTKTKAVIDQPAVDLEPHKQAIADAENMEQLNQVGKDIAALNLGEPEKTDMRNLWNARKAELTAHQIPQSSIDSIIAEFEGAADIEALDAIAASRFEPITAQLTDEQSYALNEAYERRIAELTD